MIEQSEIVTLFLAIGCVILVIIKRKQVRRFPFSSLLLISFFCLFLGLTITVLKAFFLQNLLNLLEHFSYTLSTIFLSSWCWNIAFKNKDAL